MNARVCFAVRKQNRGWLDSCCGNIHELPPALSFPKFPGHISKLHPQNIMQLVWYKMVLWNITKFSGCKWTLWAVISNVSSCVILFTVIYYVASVVVAYDWCLGGSDDVPCPCKVRDTHSCDCGDLEILTEVNVEITVRLDVLTAENVEITLRFIGSHSPNCWDCCLVWRF
jgi:hypothetical protein